MNIAGATANTFTIASASVDDAAIYDAVISNALGTTSSAPAGLGVYVTAGKIDPSFNPGTGPNNTVFASAVLGNGNVAIGGGFTAVNGQPRARFAVLHADGALVNLTSNPSFNQQVTAIAAQPDGRFYVATFSEIARYNADGTRDTTFPVIGQQGMAIALQGAHVYFAGYFSSNSGQKPSVKKFNTATGAADTTFAANATAIIGWSSFSIHVYSDGRVLVGDGLNGIRRLNADGTTDASFTPPAIAYSGGGARPIYAIEVTEDGLIWIGGLFTSVGGQPRNFLARLNADGSVDESLPDAGLNSQVRSLLLLGSDVLVGGDFSRPINGANYRGIVKVSGATGVIDPTFGPVLADSGVNSITPTGGGKVLLAGSFSRPPAYLAHAVVQSDVALTITGQPAGTDVKAGESATFTVAWKGGGEATYQWTKDGQNITDAKGQSFIIKSIAESDAGKYAVVVSGGGQTVTSAAAALRINGSSGSGGPGGFEEWKAQFTLPAGLDQEDADGDGDRLPNIAEFAFGTNPTQATSAKSPENTVVSEGGQTYPAVTFIRSKFAPGVSVHVTVSSSIAFTDDLGSTSASTEDLGNGTERVTIRSNASASSKPNQFLKVDITKP